MVIMDFDPKYLEKKWLFCKQAIGDRELRIKAFARFLDDDDDRLLRQDLLIKAIESIDLTTLSGDDTPVRVKRLYRAAAASAADGFPRSAKCAAVCVYPSRVGDVSRYREHLRRIGSANDYFPKIASVATGFPSGQTDLDSRLDEIRFAVKSGADEIDVVINREMALRGDWHGVYDELRQMREACGKAAHMKSILAVKLPISKNEQLFVSESVVLGELGSLAAVYAASMVSMMAGADFIKTSTGKEAQFNADLKCGIVMATAINDFRDISRGFKVGLKPAGGLKTFRHALEWMVLVQIILGPEWCNRELFRIGASGLYDDLLSKLKEKSIGWTE